MGTTLTGTTPQDTYDSLIKVTDNGPLSGSLKTLTDGLGNDSALALSTGAARVTGTLAVTSGTISGNDAIAISAVNLNTNGTTFALNSAGTVGIMTFLTASTERMRITSAGNVTIGTTFEAGKLTVEQPSAARVATLIGNSNAQGFAQNHRVVRHYPVVSLGTKLIIPFVSQGSLNSTTIVRVFGHSARFNSTSALAFTADFEVGHLTSIQASATLSSTGNVASIASNGASAMEITFTSAYTAATGDGVFVTIEYMTNNVGFSIDVPNITMN